MPDPTDQINQLDLQNLPPEEAAKLIRAHAQALAAQQHHALLGMLGTVPELQEAGKAEYSQAGRERGTTQELGPQVLKQALGEREAAARIKELQIQGQQQLGMLKIATAQLGLQAQNQGFEQTYKKFMAELSSQKPAPTQLLGEMEQTQLHLAAAQKIGLPDFVTSILQSKLKAQNDTLEKSGYRSEGPPVWGGGANSGSVIPSVVPPQAGQVPTAMVPPQAQPAGKILVRDKKTGQQGRISPQFFNPDKYEKLPGQ